jgi:hypothetical protein
LEKSIAVLANIFVTRSHIQCPHAEIIQFFVSAFNTMGRKHNGASQIFYIRRMKAESYPVNTYGEAVAVNAATAVSWNVAIAPAAAAEGMFSVLDGALATIAACAFAGTATASRAAITVVGAMVEPRVVFH